MMSWDVRFAFTGVDVVKKLPDLLGQSIDETLAAMVRRLLGQLRRRSPVSDRKGCGELKGSWQATAVNAGSIQFGTNVEHAPYVEIGGPFDQDNAANWPKAGPRTKQVDGRIFSRQAPGGIIKPILNDQGLIDEIFDAIITEITHNLERASRGA